MSIVDSIKHPAVKAARLLFKIISTSAHAPTTIWDADLSGACAVVFGNSPM